MSSSPRQGVIILGMHRSGTSALAGALARLGFMLPKTPLEASADNPKGFFESLRIFDANFKILLVAGCSWNVCFSLEPAELPGRFKPELVEGLHWLLCEEFGDTGSFVLKDPRMCLLLPVWLPALRCLTPILPVLLTLRHPMEVVHSHVVRHHLAEEDILLNWLHHMLEAERISRSMRRAVLQYSALLQDWRGVLALALRTAEIVPPIAPQDAAAAMDAFIMPGMRHHMADEETACIGPPHLAHLVDAAWRSLSALASNSLDMLAMATLDSIRADVTMLRQDMIRRGFCPFVPEPLRRLRAELQAELQVSVSFSATT
jgi:hypothetical protein